MNEYSFSDAINLICPAPDGRPAARRRPATSATRSCGPRPRCSPRTAIFQSQVADVARVAGVAAGTVYLYFKSKDDLLVSIFERIDERRPRRRAGGARRRCRPGRAAAAGSRTCISNASAATRTSPSSFQVELRQSVKFMERFSETFLQDYFKLIRAGHCRRPAERRVPQGHQRHHRHQDFLRRARRDGHQLGAEPAQVRPRRRSRRGRRPLHQRSQTPVSLRSPINSVTVLGAGTMGAQIALHCANAGIPALLLDLTADVAKQGLEKARKLKPDPQFTPDAYKLVTTGGFDTHLDLIAKTDWIMEAVVERLDIKQQLLAKVDEKRRPGSIVSSNTSGIPIAAMAEGRSDDFRQHWLGTHFFNPPRYLRLLEIIPTADTDPAVVAADDAGSAITCSARASSSRRTRRTSSPTTSACTASRARSRCWRAASTPSKRSMRSPARRSAVPAARRSGRWTSPASTCSRT